MFVIVIHRLYMCTIMQFASVIVISSMLRSPQRTVKREHTAAIRVWQRLLATVSALCHRTQVLMGVEYDMWH